MKGNWGSAILLYVVSCVLYVPYGILNRGGAIAGLAVLLLIFVYLPINFGLLRTFLAFARDKRPLTIEGLFCAFNNTYYWKAIGTGLLSGIYTFLWTLLLIVPGIIKGLSYAMALYIVSDNPEIGCDEAIISHAARHDRLVASQPAHARYRYAVDSPLLPNCLREFLP